MKPADRLEQHPLVYEINTRCWLNGMGAGQGRTMTLRDGPEDEFDRWRRLGFTHVWLMGVWSSGPRSCQVYLDQPDTAHRLDQALPGWTVNDVTGSAYAIAEYRVPDALGGESGLAAFREKLHSFGLRLLLDFVPNHLGLDHPWLAPHPERFMPGREHAIGSFLQHTAIGPRWLAHGKDPYFPAWIDTAQLDHRRADTRTVVIDQLRSVAARCDGVRCDMAMLVLNEVFARNWPEFSTDAPGVETEFWSDAIAATRRPGFLFVAEAYWDLEARLQSLGFDFTYDKRVLDFLIERRPVELRDHLLAKGDDFIGRSAHFLENHDEPRIAPRMTLAEHRTAALLTLALPGMTMLHEGQLAGWRQRTPIHLARRPVESTDRAIASLYETLLTTVAASAVGKGEGHLLFADPAAADVASTSGIIAIQWTGPGLAFDLVLVNLAAHSTSCCLSARWPVDRPPRWTVRDCLSPGIPAQTILAGEPLRLELPAHAAQLLHLQPEG